MAERVDNPVEPDLEKLRDDKVFPIARTVFKDIAEMLVPEDANLLVDYTPLVVNILQHSLDADLNITMEAQYLFQVLLGLFSGLNATVQKAEMAPIDERRYGAIGREILQAVMDANPRLGSVTPEETEADFAPVLDKVNAIFAREKLTQIEVRHVMDSMFDGFTTVNNLYSSQLEKHTATAEAKLFGIDDMNDLTLGHLDQVLKATIIKKDDLSETE